MDHECDPQGGSAAISTPSRRRSTDAQIARWLAVFQEAFGKELSRELVEIYMEALADLSPVELERGCQVAFRTCKFFPAVAEIFEAARPAPADALLLDAERAWEAYQARLDRFCTLDGIEQPRFEPGNVRQSIKPTSADFTIFELCSFPSAPPRAAEFLRCEILRYSIRPEPVPSQWLAYRRRLRKWNHIT